jgi:hypothetical protein
MGLKSSSCLLFEGLEHLLASQSCDSPFLKSLVISQVSRACEPCRRSKTKCDEQRPCSRCTQRRTISQCLGKVPLQSINGYVECARIERPMAFDGLQTLAVDGGGREGGGKSMWELLPSFEAGWSDDALGSLFERMPLSLRTELLQGLRVLDGVKQVIPSYRKILTSNSQIFRFQGRAYFPPFSYFLLLAFIPVLICSFCLRRRGSEFPTTPGQWRPSKPWSGRCDTVFECWSPWPKPG